ncbi:E3 ubiquitin-protein ligase hel2 [Paramyrothecium foliicola]|nr:E3 ubiquitin-protein ligase hel2 [Paramyrothecium foliicola]
MYLEQPLTPSTLDLSHRRSFVRQTTMSAPESGGAPTATAPSSRGDGQRGGRGRGGSNRGPRAPRGDGSGEGRPANRGQRRGGRGGGGGGRGGAGHRRGGSRDEALQTMPAEPAAQEVAAAARRPGVPAAAEGEDADDDAEVCFICANPVAHYSIAPCNHATCHICALRMRALYKTKDCAHCRTPASFVIFTDESEKRFDQYTDADISTTDTNIGIKYAKEDIVGDTVLLLRYNCPDPSCDFAGLGWPDLHRHVKSAHRKRMCDLCTRNKKVFTHEHELFADRELERHMRHGDDKPGSADQTGFKGHPLCGFCGERFYDDDKLYEHCRMKHERCFLCDRRDSRKPHYYMDYNALEDHFRKDHYLCADRECLEKKFVVFDSEMDLQAHQISEHGGKNAGRDARLVDISGFDLRQPYNNRDEGRRGGRRGARGRDPNADNGIPAVSGPSTQNLRRDELAFQRQMAIHSAQSVSNRTFGGSLTTPSAPATTAVSASSSARPSRTGTPANVSSSSTPAPSTAAARPANSSANLLATSVESLTISDPSNLTPEERARVVRHGSVIERAANLLGNDAHKLTRFREHISSYRRGGFTATQLVDAFFTLFADTSSNALGTLVKELADLFDDKKKADDLRKAWQNWRAINEDYPSLPALGSMHGATSSSRGSGWASAVSTSNPAVQQAPSSQKHSNRVLKLKNSTRLAGPAPTSTPASRGPPGWVPVSSSSSGGVKPPSSASSAFPSLPPAASSSRQGGSSSRPTWIGSLTQPSSSSSSSPAPSASRTGSGGGGGGRGAGSRGADNFPALPSAPKPTTTIFGYGTGRAVRRDYGHAESNFQWGGASSAAGTPTGEEENNDGDEDAGGKGKKGGKKGKKQVLVQWG